MQCFLYPKTVFYITVTGRAMCGRFGVTGSGLQGLAAPGPIAIPALIPCLSLSTVNAWELGEGYNVAQSIPGQGGVLTGGGMCSSHIYWDKLSDPATTDVAGTH